MSLDYTTYVGTKRPLSPKKIVPFAKGWELVFVDAGTGKPLPITRALPTYCLVWGCRRKAKLDLVALIRAKDESGLASLARRELVGSCELEGDFDFQADAEFLTELPARVRSALAIAQTRYDTRSSAGQNDLSWRLQIALCRAIVCSVGDEALETSCRHFIFNASRTLIGGSIMEYPRFAPPCL